MSTFAAKKMWHKSFDSFGLRKCIFLTERPERRNISLSASAHTLSGEN